MVDFIPDIFDCNDENLVKISVQRYCQNKLWHPVTCTNPATL